MSDTHDTIPQADTPPVMVAIGADLIREAVECLKDGATHAKWELREYGWNAADKARIGAEIARMEATAKALAEALPGDRV